MVNTGSRFSEGTAIRKDSDDYLITTEDEVGVAADRFDSIQSAIEYAVDKDIRKVHVPAGHYVDGELGGEDQLQINGDQIPGEFSIVGAGRDATVLESTTDITLRFLNDVDSVEVRNLTLKGADEDGMIRATYLNECTFQNIRVEAVDEPFRAWRATSALDNITIRDMVFSGDGRRALDMGTDTDHKGWHIDGYRVDPDYEEGIRITGSEHIIKGAYIPNNDQSAVEARDTLENVVLTSSVVEGIVGDGADLLETAGVIDLTE